MKANIEIDKAELVKAVTEYLDKHYGYNVIGNVQWKAGRRLTGVGPMEQEHYESYFDGATVPIEVEAKR